MLDALRRAHTVEKLIRFAYQFLYGLAWIYVTVFKPVLRPVWRGVIWFCRQWHTYIWEPNVYLKTGHFSKIRAGWVILGTVFCVYLCLPVSLGGAFLVEDTALYLFTKQTEHAYLKPASEIDYVHDIWSISGTLIDANDKRADATEDNSIYFRVQNSVFNEIWSLLHRGTLFYPDYVAAPPKYGSDDCTIVSYGFRRKVLRQRWNIYPDALDIRCSQAHENVDALGHSK